MLEVGSRVLSQFEIAHDEGKGRAKGTQSDAS